MKSAFSGAKVTIAINGSTSGFITPTRGLRQGCPMSPYSFIIAMELFTRLMNKMERLGIIEGIKLAHTSPVLTHLIYADDLVVLGRAEQREFDSIKEYLACFGQVSGLIVNPAKSKIWFSRACGDEEVLRATNALQANEAQDEERYLGALLAGNSSAKKTGQLILDKMRAKLAGWKTHMLSHAGRLVLLKSVLMSLPVYYMSVERLPKGIIKEMNSLMAKFFWGKTGQQRYMAMVAWRKICKPIEEGGLGVRNLESFGEALLLKLAWVVISESDRPWVHVCKAKYCPQIGIWDAKEQSNSSTLWRQIIKLKEFFREDVCWRLGNGKKVKALAQPWFHGWQNHKSTSREDKNLRVADLFAFEANCWKTEELTRLFSLQQALIIQNEVEKPVSQSVTKDMLIWKRSKRGNYSVKEGYQCIERQRDPIRTEANELWIQISNWRGVVPKIKIFLWRLISGALTLASNMNRRISNWSPMCQRCQLENEFESHCFFFCPGSRVIWFASNLGLRTHDLSLSIVQAVKECIQSLGEDQIKEFGYTMWEIWKARNATVIQQKKFDPVEVSIKVRNWLQVEAQSKEMHHTGVSKHTDEAYYYQAEGWQVIVDGSWDTLNKVGCAHLIYKRGRIYAIGYNCHILVDSFHAETVALKEALIHISMQWEMYRDGEIEIYSDCQQLVNILVEKDMDNIPSWVAMEDVCQILTLIDKLPTRVWLKKVSRKAVQQVHNLANNARRRNVQYQGIPRPYVEFEKDIAESIDVSFFQRVQEAPP
ncbi:RNA-directed DNA polymerase (reverse transcriptase)-related family protein [Rhynchospora pubera]|uniref:RNA-directed DNA polymerase (Reverse transcriptase)-related family protein n=1 Tax=Rhynchospora pubera TaxID=906938 RepID=A0AAV8ENG9_9POAL|nr:RNA-directed DNA polymerase (reverse transcriptase)-related family protein [Rhynchospora pubera]